jgi:arginase
MPPVVVVPFHQDERLGSDSIVLPAEVTGRLVDPTVPTADQWTRLSVPYDRLATEVAASLESTNATMVVTGDCLALLGTLAGSQRAGLDPSDVWFDPHGDVGRSPARPRTPRGSPRSGCSGPGRVTGKGRCGPDDQG